MKSKLIVSVLVIASGLVGVSSMADGSSAKTRAQVRAELAAAQRDGSYPLWIGEERNEKSSSPEAMLASGLSGMGEINLPATAAGPRTRQSVMDEFLRAQANGTLPKLPDTGE